MSELTGHRDEEKGRLATAGGLLKSTHHIRIQGRNQLVLFKFEITGGKHIAHGADSKVRWVANALEE